MNYYEEEDGDILYQKGLIDTKEGRKILRRILFIVTIMVVITVLILEYK